MSSYLITKGDTFVIFYKWGPEQVQGKEKGTESNVAILYGLVVQSSVISEISISGQLSGSEM